MRKKLFSALMSASIAVAMMSGCGLNAPAQTEGSQGTSQEVKENTEDTNVSEEQSEYEVNEAAAADPAVTLTMAEVNPIEGTICGAMDTKFKEAVEAMSGGSITIDLQGSGVLGVEADILDGMLGGTGTVDICRISAFALNSYGCDKATLLSLPYTFQDRDHFWTFANSDLAQDFLNQSSEIGLGVKGLYYGEEGFRHFFTAPDKPISSPEDMKDMKIRVSNDPVMTAMVQNLGATPSPVSMSEIYQSLQNGTIDGAEQPTANYKSNSFDEVGPNLTMDGHTLGAMMTIITEKSWGELTENQQQVILDAGKIASDYCREVSEQKENEVLEQLKADGRTIIEVEDKTPWQEACKPIVEQYATGDLADIYQQILDMAK
ncbi:TRAP transporter substrate-binding protein [Butyrivibrio fibrisolvens]|jgi:tripartite ATP-independent transporter DctP family solute receptor|uniref:C4-dicarboxylate ABC transporter substrate-binding protein n=1 Tax=Butyrivibrio fibrisolvens TaxID=831 RepID=A0A317FZS6_BUTFI|nr:TRAP transporter substrate-binding protein [Butyrivibrio fibrisolvens]PWT25732.1 C4-dicarboxylate ABC transporter substrate-binding protein [Butyrivibrio fibrisolvens]PWT27235.1 C4-dicarboxylate ABC transporter substrate-binding protein [Butyrivibrio fibrisolvens]